MLLPESGVRLWLYTPPTDMRKSFDGLSALVRQKLAEDPTSGQLFVFINRKRTQLKVLYFEQGGYCLWSKRLEAGRFHFNVTVHSRPLLPQPGLSESLFLLAGRSLRLGGAGILHRRQQVG